MAYQNFFATRLFTDIGTSDTTITLETPPTVTAGRLVLEARNATQREIIEYTGVSGNDITGVTRGVGGTSAKSHLKNSLVEMNMTAQDLIDLYDAFDAFTETAGDGWLPMVEAVTVGTGHNVGGKIFDLTVAAADVSDTLSPGMKIKVTRSVTPPTQCAHLDGSTQNASLASPTGLDGITSTITCMAWVKLDSYTSNNGIVSRISASDGWALRVQSDGRLRLGGRTTSVANADILVSNVKVPLNEWVHVAAVLTMNSGGAMYINGESVGVDFTNGSDTTIGVGGDLEIGSLAGGNFFDGRLCQVSVWDVALSGADIRQYFMCQELTGSESNLVGYWPLDGDFTDATANNNNLTANGGAVATDLDNPFNAIEYGIVTDVTYSAPDTTVRVYTGKDYMIPNMTLNSPHFSTHEVPYGMTNDDKGSDIIHLPASIAPKVWTNPYCFRAEASVAQTGIVDAIFTKLNFDTELYDYNNNFDSSAYIAPVDGVYHFSAGVLMTGSGSHTSAILAVYVNGVAINGYLSRIGAGAINDTAPGGATDCLLNAGDVVEIYGFCNTSGGTWSTVNTANRTWFSGHLVHAT